RGCAANASNTRPSPPRNISSQGIAAPRAVVATITEKLTGAPDTEALGGVGIQLAALGVPVHDSDTTAVSPDTGAITSEYVVPCPAVTVADVDPLSIGATVKSPPVPESVTVCGEFGALSLIVNVPFWLPVAVGLKSIASVQLVPAATCVPHVLPLSVAYPGETATEVICSITPPLLLTVTLCVPVVPTIWVPNVSVFADSVAVGVDESPVPDSATVCGLVVALSVSVSAPERMPVTVGVNVTVIAQLAWAASDAPQVLVAAKSPVAAMPVNESAAVVLLVTVTVCVALAVFTTWPPKSSVPTLNDSGTFGAIPAQARKN